MSKRILSVILVTVMVLISGCGHPAPAPVTDSPKTESQSQAAAPSVEGTTVEARLVSFDGTWLIFEYEGTRYSMSLSETMINTTTLHAGDTLLITYQGLLSPEDTSTCRVLSVSTKEDNDTDSHELVGTLEDITMNAITVRVNDGRVITFNATNAKHSFSYGINEGNWVTIIYNGDLVGTDTTNIAVTRIHDEDTNYVKEVKAQTTIQEVDDTVYALQDAGVRSSYMMASEFLGTLKARQGIQRTGICNNGWNRVIWNGSEAYIYGKLLTTEANEADMQEAKEDVSQKVKIKDLEAAKVAAEKTLKEVKSMKTPYKSVEAAKKELRLIGQQLDRFKKGAKEAEELTAALNASQASASAAGAEVASNAVRASTANATDIVQKSKSVGKKVLTGALNVVDPGRVALSWWKPTSGAAKATKEVVGSAISLPVWGYGYLPAYNTGYFEL